MKGGEDAEAKRAQVEAGGRCDVERLRPRPSETRLERDREKKDRGPQEETADGERPADRTVTPGDKDRRVRERGERARVDERETGACRENVGGRERVRDARPNGRQPLDGVIDVGRELDDAGCRENRRRGEKQPQPSLVFQGHENFGSTYEERFGSSRVPVC